MGEGGSMSERSKVNIELSYQDLCRIIESNPEAGIEIKQGIINTFAEKHLKPLLTSEAAKKVLDRIRVGINAEIDKQVCKSSGGHWNKVVTLNEDVTKSITEYVAMEVQSHIKKNIDKYIPDGKIPAIETRITEKLKDMERDIKNLVEKKIDLAFEERVAEEVEKRMEEVRKVLYGSKD